MTWPLYELVRILEGTQVHTNMNKKKKKMSKAHKSTVFFFFEASAFDGRGTKHI